MATPKTLFFLDRIPDIVVPFDRVESIYFGAEVPSGNESKDYIKAGSHDSKISPSSLLRPLNPQTV